MTTITDTNLKGLVLYKLRHSNCEKRVSKESIYLFVIAFHTSYSERAIRKAIRELRLEGHHIVGDTKRGGYYMSNSEEWDAFCEQQRRRAIHNFYKKSDETDTRQMRIVFD